MFFRINAAYYDILISKTIKSLMRELFMAALVVKVNNKEAN
jgi:hypothetical protein